MVGLTPGMSRNNATDVATAPSAATTSSPSRVSERVGTILSVILTLLHRPRSARNFLWILYELLMGADPSLD